MFKPEGKHWSEQDDCSVMLCVRMFLLWIQTKFEEMKKQMGSMEVEVMEARLLRATELNGEMNDEDETGKVKYFWTSEMKWNLLDDEQLYTVETNMLI